MDLASQEAPAALTRPAGDEASALTQRIAHTESWLLDQHAFWPAIPVHAPPVAMTTFVEELAAFWQAPVAPYPGYQPVTREQAFALRWAAVMADEAMLRVADGSLDERTKESILAFTRAQGHLTPPHIQVRELMVGDLPYAGSVVVVDQHKHTALLFTADRGWERFSELDALHGEVEERLREMLASTTHLPGLADDDSAVLSGDESVTSRDIASDPFGTLTANIVDVQRRKVIDAWTLRDSREGWSLRLADRLDGALAPWNYLDVATILQRRQARLLTSVQDLRLSQLPAPIREPWERALADYQTALAEVGQTLARDGFDQITSIDQFARNELGALLQSRGITDDPADITIELFSTTISTIHGYSGTDVERRSLVDLARENIGFLETRAMQARTRSGGYLLTLKRDDIVDALRTLDLKSRYQDYLVTELKTSARGQRLRAASARLQEARMRFDLADARTTTYLPDETNDFIDDHAERAYHWVKAVLDAPASAERRRIDNHDIVVSQLVYEGTRVKDILVLGVRSQGSVNRTVFYTPDAPDGRNFREFSDRQAAASGFLNHPAFERYLLERLPGRWSTVARPLAKGRFADDEIAGNIFDASYDVALGQLGIDAADASRSTSEADVDHAASLGMLSARIGEGFLPVRLSVAIGSVRALHAVWEGIEHVGRDERAAAFEAFVSAFSFVGDLAGSQVFARSLSRTVLAKVPGRPRQLTAGHLGMPDRGTRFDARYIAHDVRLKEARLVNDGIYDIGGARYIEHDGQAYGVSFDHDNGTWRLRKPRHTPADYAPPVVRDNTGQWRHSTKVGLNGGSPDRPDLYDREPAGLLIEYRGLTSETAGLSTGDIHHMVQALTGQGLRSGVLKRLIYDRTHDQPTTATLTRRWNAALADVHRPPPRIRMPPAPVAPAFSLKKLERSQWPRTVWHYTTPYRHAMFNGKALTLNQSLPASTGPSGLHVMTLDPSRPSRQIVGIMRGTRRAGTFTDAQVENIAGAYVEIDLYKLRDRQRVDGTFEFNLYTVTGRTGLEFVIKPTLPAPDRRIAPMSPREQRDLAAVSLRPGEFRTGTRLP